MSDGEVSLVTPAYKSVRYLGDHVDQVMAFFERAGIDGEVVVADDGSLDGTADSVTESDRIRVLRLPHQGKGAAVRAGIAASGPATSTPPLPFGAGALMRAMRPRGRLVRQGRR